MAQPQRVLVTRAPHQGSALAERLLAFGLDPVLIPAIQILPPSSLEALDSELDKPGQFQWIVLTSANAVPVFVDRLGGRVLPGTTRIAAIGPATARALQAANLPVDLVPPEAVAESLASALLPFAVQPSSNPTRFLLIRAEEGRDHLPDRLRQAGAEVRVVPAYRTVVAQDSVDLVASLFQGQSDPLDAITFTSSSSVRNLLALCEAAQVQLPGAALRVSIGPITSATLRQAGYPPHAEAPVATVESLAETVANVLRADIRG